MPEFNIYAISTTVVCRSSVLTPSVPQANIRLPCRGTRYILRKKPAGTIISPVAHQVDREFRVLKALGSVEGFPVPKVYTLCMNSEVIGTPFYVRVCRVSAWLGTSAL